MPRGKKVPAGQSYSRCQEESEESEDSSKDEQDEADQPDQVEEEGDEEEESNEDQDEELPDPIATKRGDHESRSQAGSSR